jgi:hypothetical protein
MRILPSLACLSLLTALAACGETSGSYYDANGRYVQGNTDSTAPFEHDVTLRDRMRNGNYRSEYDRRGYYDDEGNYSNASEIDGLSVPKNMFPARGMCRVWFTDRAPARQPNVESCKNIKQRVPTGAYVIYGG